MKEHQRLLLAAAAVIAAAFFLLRNPGGGAQLVSVQRLSDYGDWTAFSRSTFPKCST